MKRRPVRSGFTLVELLVVLAIIGILVGLLLPAVQMVREAGRQTQCKNNLKQLGLAVQAYEAAIGHIPPSRANDGFLTWPVLIMPWIEMQSLQDQFDLKAKYAAVNPAVSVLATPMMSCPTRRGPGETSDFETKGEPPGAVGDYAGNAGTSEHFPNLVWAGFTGEPDGVFNSGLATENPVHKNRLIHGPKGRYRMTDIQDGLSHTLFIGEKAVSYWGERQPGGWGDGCIYSGEEPGTAMRLGGIGFGLAPTYRIDAPGPGSIPIFGSHHPGFVNFSVGDGSVQTLSVSIAEETLRRLCARDDGTITSFE